MAGEQFFAELRRALRNRRVIAERCGLAPETLFQLFARKVPERRIVAGPNRLGQIGAFLAARNPVEPGPEGVKALARSILESFPDYHETVEDLVASGDRVAVRLTLRGTNTGPLPDGSPATGLPIEFTDMTIVRIAAGRIAELWGLSDHLSMMAQLGAIELPQRAKD